MLLGLLLLLHIFIFTRAESIRKRSFIQSIHVDFRSRKFLLLLDLLPFLIHGLMKVI